MPKKRARRRRRPQPTRHRSGVSRREFWLCAVGTWIVTWFSSRPPRQDAGEPRTVNPVELSGGTHHRVDAGSVSWSFQTTQPTVTVVRAPVIWLA